MPTPEEIENLAKQYAEFTDLSVVDQLRVKLISKEFLTWVLRDYCIVPKSKLKELYDCYRQHEQTCKAKGLHNATLIAIGSQATMRDIFGDSLFEEK